MNLSNLLQEAGVYVYSTLAHNALFLILGIIIAAVITVHVDPEKFKTMLLKRANISLLGSVAFGAFTPFCACGTMAVIVAMMASALPWGPVMAFLTSSPLMSPDGFVMISGVLGTKFALALTIASLIIGLGSGYITYWIEKRTTFLNDQVRLVVDPVKSRYGNEPALQVITCCSSNQINEPSGDICTDAGTSRSTVKITGTPKSSLWEQLKGKEMLQVIIEVGVKKVLFNFAIFAAIAFIINKFIPTEVITQFLGAGNLFAVPVSALVGLPLYVSGPSSLPIIDMLVKSGAGEGAMLAFMITGPGTSAGVIAGIATIMKKRAITLYVMFILVWGIVLGYSYDLLLALGI